LFHTTAQVAAAWHPLAEQIAELSWSLTRPALQAGVRCSQDQTVGGPVMGAMSAMLYGHSTRVSRTRPAQLSTST
jgi:hypothetical protein